MEKYSPNWNGLFLLSLGLFIGGLFGMSLIENDLFYNGSRKFSVIGLELYYPRQKIVDIFSALDDKVRTILRYHLIYDFVFMTGCYPGIVCLCMIASKKVQSINLKKVLIILGFLQLIPWLFDIIENYLLLKWLNNPIIGNEFGFYHPIVYSKWIIAALAAMFALSIIVISMFKKKN